MGMTVIKTGNDDAFCAVADADWRSLLDVFDGVALNFKGGTLKRF